MNIEMDRLFRDWEDEAMYKVQHGNYYDTPWNYYTDDCEDAFGVAQICVIVLNEDYAVILKKDETPGRYISIGRFEKKEEIVRCKDCKHRPTMPAEGRGVQDLIFPSIVCPMQCGDPWYNWQPADDWYCANGERTDEE